MNGLTHRRSGRPGATPAPSQRRWSNVAGNRDAKMNPAKAAAADLALKIPTLEAEILGLRQLLADVRVNREELRREMDDLRRDRDGSNWRNRPNMRKRDRGLGFAVERRQALRRIR